MQTENDYHAGTMSGRIRKPNMQLAKKTRRYQSPYQRLQMPCFRFAEDTTLDQHAFLVKPSSCAPHAKDPEHHCQ